MATTRRQATREREAKKRCYLRPGPRGAFEGKIKARWTVKGKFDIPAGSTFILWRLGNEDTGLKLVELAPPDGDVRTTAILLLKVYHVQGNHYFGTRRINLTGPTAVTTSARFNVYENESDFGLMVD